MITEHSCQFLQVDAPNDFETLDTSKVIKFVNRLIPAGSSRILFSRRLVSHMTHGQMSESTYFITNHTKSDYSAEIV